MRYDRSIRKVLHQGLLSARAGGFFFGFNFIVGTGAIVCVLWFGARQVVDDKLSPGELSSFVIYALYVGANTGALAGVVSSLIQVLSRTLSSATSSMIHLILPGLDDARSLLSR